MDNYPHKLMLRPLLAKLTPFLPGHTPTCAKNVLIVALALLRRQTVCRDKLKAVVGAITGRHATAADSHYKRLIRFFDDHAAGDLWLDVVACAVRLLRLKSRYLILDGTSWRRPSGWHHLLTLCVVYRGVAVPIAWLDLAKRGCSNLSEREALFALVADRFDLRGKVLLADREYIGAEWFKFLIDRGSGFCIRSRDYAYFPLVDRSAPGQPRLREAIRRVTASAKPNKARRFRFRFAADGPWLYFVVARNPDPRAKERVMSLVTTEDRGAYRIVEAYLERWKIEHCFRHPKTNGFNLELLNLRGAERQRLLIAVVVFAYALSIAEGLKTYAERVATKTHGSAARRYPAVSVFRYGIDRLHEAKADLVTFCRYLVRALTRAMAGYRSATILNV